MICKPNILHPTTVLVLTSDFDGTDYKWALIKLFKGKETVTVSVMFPVKLPRDFSLYPTLYSGY